MRSSVSVCPEIVDFGSGQGLSVFCRRRYSGAIPQKLNGCAIIAKKRKRRPGPKDAVSGWARVRPILTLALVLLVFSAAAVGHALEIPALPAAPVVDLAGIVDSGAETKLNRYLKELQTKTGAQMAILTVNSLEGQAIEDFSINIAHDRWKLGQKNKDNGVLIVVALSDKKYRIEIGYGLEGLLPDSLVGSIGRQYLVPYFKKGDYSTGIYAAAVIMANEIARDAGVEITGLPAVKEAYPAKKSRKSSGILGKIFSLLFFVIMVILFIKNPRLFLAFLFLSSMGGRSGRWGGSGGGFGGGGFGGGGGGFGGGGASGGW
jgi:uncharacterized protein